MLNAKWGTQGAVRRLCVRGIMRMFVAVCKRLKKSSSLMTTTSLHRKKRVTRR